MKKFCYCELPLMEHTGPCIGLAVAAWDAGAAGAAAGAAAEAQQRAEFAAAVEQAFADGSVALEAGLIGGE